MQRGSDLLHCQGQVTVVWLLYIFSLKISDEYLPVILYVFHVTQKSDQILGHLLLLAHFYFSVGRGGRPCFMWSERDCRLCIPPVDRGVLIHTQHQLPASEVLSLCRLLGLVPALWTVHSLVFSPWDLSFTVTSCE